MQKYLNFLAALLFKTRKGGPFGTHVQVKINQINATL